MDPPELPAIESARPCEPFYDDGRRWRWIAPVALAGAGWCVIGLITYRFSVIPSADAQSREVFSRLSTILGATGLVLGTVGLVIGLHRARPNAPVYLPSVTVTLAALAGMGYLSVATFALTLAGGVTSESEHTFRFMIALMGGLATALMALSVLRACRARAAAVLMPAFALTVLPMFPVGTAMSVLWFLSVRERESSAV